MTDDSDDIENPTQNPLPIKDQKLQAGLYLVATPIGNIRDITLRALDTLSAADIVACEDTRMTGKLFSLLGIKKKLLPYHDHNADEQRPRIMNMITDGLSIALVSDAGMPLISDPGYKLVRACREQGLYVTSVPGASASLTALQLSGLPSDRFAFLGFLPAKSKHRKEVLADWQATDGTLVIFESGQRVEECCMDILGTLGDREMALTRELTKKFEDVWSGRVSDILDRLARDGAPKGEIVLVVARAEPSTEADQSENLDHLLMTALQNHSLKDAVAIVTETTGLPKKTVYAKALEMKNDGEAPA